MSEGEGGRSDVERQGGVEISNHDSDAFVIYTVVVDGGLQEVGIFFEPKLHVLTVKMLNRSGVGWERYTILVGLGGMEALLEGGWWMVDGEVIVDLFLWGGRLSEI